MLNFGILLALACAVVTQLGFLYKHRGANEAPRVDMRHPLRTVRDLFSSKWFAIGMAVATSAWFFHVAALAFAPLSVVQAVLSTGVVILAVMAERMFGFKVGARQWIGVAMTAAGLFLLVITLPASSGAHSSYSLAGMISFEAGMLAIGALLITGPRIGAPDHHHGVMLGGAAGVLFGVSDVAIKALTGLHDGVLGLIFSPWLAGSRMARPCRSSPPPPPPPTCRASSAASSSSATRSRPTPSSCSSSSSPSRWSSSPRWSHRRPCGRRRRTRSGRLGRRLQQDPRDLLRVVPGRDVAAALERDVAGVGQEPLGAGALAPVEQEPVALAPGDRDRDVVGVAAEAVLAPGLHRRVEARRAREVAHRSGRFVLRDAPRPAD